MYNYDKFKLLWGIIFCDIDAIVFTFYVCQWAYYQVGFLSIYWYLVKPNFFYIDPGDGLQSVSSKTLFLFIVNLSSVLTSENHLSESF